MTAADFLLEPDIVLQRVVEVFNSAGVDYLVGGATASNNYGKPRLTRDVDFAARISLNQVTALAQAFGEDFYVDEDMIRAAIENGSSFNVIYLPFSFKADIFIASDGEWTREEFARRREIKTFTSGFLYYVSSPEDSILHKLQWFELGGRVSDNQWRDIQEMLNVQRTTLDLDYLHHWAASLGLLNLLHQAIAEADKSIGA